MTRIVVDSNVVISSILSPAGPPAKVLAAVRRGIAELVVSRPILREYARALAYPRLVSRHGLTEEAQAAESRLLAQLAVEVNPPSVPRVVPEDPDDDIFIATAMEGRADYLVTGDQPLLRAARAMGITAVSPGDFLAILDSYAR